MTEARLTVKWSIDAGVEPVVVYADEVPLLERDRLLYGNVFVKPDADGVHVRINPKHVHPEAKA